MPKADLQRLLDEISEQPGVVARVLEQQRAAASRVADEIRGRDPAAIVLVARGSSDNAAVYGRYLFEVCNRRLTCLAAPSSLTLYGCGPRLDNTLVIGVSQSGQGEDVVEYVRSARAQGAATVAIVNETDSPLGGVAEIVLACLAGPEISVPATKTVTAQMTLLALISAQLQGSDPRVLEPLPDALAQAIGQRSAAASVAQAIGSRTLGSVIGRGFAFPTALEIALKLKETAYTPAEPFSAADFLHGPVALVEEDYTALVVDAGGRSSQAATEIAGAIRARSGQAVVLRAGDVSPIEPDVSGLALRVGLDEPFAPIVALVLGQLVAVEVALARGLDPSQPRGLRKVTSTR